MEYKVIDAEDVVHYKDDQIDKKVLMENNNSTLMAMALKKHMELKPHTSVSDVCAFVIDGAVEFTFGEETYTVKKGQILQFKKNHEHKVKALKNSKMILYKT